MSEYRRFYQSGGHYFFTLVTYHRLKTDELIRLMSAPHLLREELIAAPAHALEYPIIIDEIQKIPMLLS